MQPLKCASFFAGVGGIDLGFKTAGFETIYANEFDAYPAKTFELNFPSIHVDVRDINSVKAEEIPDFDVMLAGFPCQAFSIAGYRKGFDDEKGRGELFFQLVRILEAKKPRIAFFENVKNLVGHDNGNTFRVICEQLDLLGYKYTYQVLNAMNYGNVAQNRERIYIVAFRDEADYEKFHWPLSVPLTNSVRDIIDFTNPVDAKYYYTAGKYKGDIYEQLVSAMKDDDKKNPAIYQWRRKYVRQNKSGVVPTLTANQGEGGHNVCLIHTDDNKIRKMTPRECFNTQGFPKDFKLPDDMSDARLYKQAGNSVCVSVISRIAEKVKEAVK
ncbi:MAG: DNA cytosine methyltransferase [Lachnospiraceae bacterium]|nr:DNA cytosine methyltransferase [Lachnospiraceae bacterium]